MAYIDLIKQDSGREHLSEKLDLSPSGDESASDIGDPFRRLKEKSETGINKEQGERYQRRITSRSTRRVSGNCGS